MKRTRTIRRIAVLAAMLLSLSLAACGGKDPRAACPQAQPGAHLVTTPSGDYKWEFAPGSRIVQCK